MDIGGKYFQFFYMGFNCIKMLVGEKHQTLVTKFESRSIVDVEKGSFKFIFVVIWAFDQTISHIYSTFSCCEPRGILINQQFGNIILCKHGKISSQQVFPSKKFITLLVSNIFSHDYYVCYNLQGSYGACFPVFSCFLKIFLFFRFFCQCFAVWPVFLDFQKISMNHFICYSLF